MERVVVYTRVSTAKQGRSGLGLEAQRKAIDEYVSRTGAKVIGTFQEVESGRKNDRPQLQEALRLCKVTGATLLAAKLDRISRSASMLFALRDSGVRFKICDFPNMDMAMLGFLAIWAEYEVNLCRERTKAAIAPKKAAMEAEGRHWGNPAGAAAFGDKRGQGAHEAQAAKADEKAKAVAPYILPLRAEGLSLAKIADRLNEMTVPTPRGGAAGWKAASVKRALDRLEAVA